MNTCYKKLWPLLALLLLVGCNRDIFISDDMGPKDTEVTLASGVGKEVTYQTEDLFMIDLHLPYFKQLDDPDFGNDNPWDNPQEESPYPKIDRGDYVFVCRFYDEAGLFRTVDQNTGRLDLFSLVQSTPRLKKLTVENMFVGLEFEFHTNNKITITNLYNLTDSTSECSLWFGYGYKVDAIDVKAESTFDTASHKYVVTGIDYGDEWCKESWLPADSIPFEAYNRGADTLRVEFPIAEYCRMYVNFNINPVFSALISDRQPPLDVAIPTYGHESEDSGGRAGWYGEKVPFSWQTVVMPGLDSALSPILVEYGWTFSKVYGFRLSPHVGVKAILDVSRENMYVDGELKLRNEDSGHEIQIPVRVRVNQPISYYLEYERVDLED